jgi:hypothetical protein
MATSHYAYNTLKMPGPMSIITVHSNKKDAVIRAVKLYQEAMEASAVKAPAPIGKALMGGKKKKTSKTSDKDSGKLSSSEYSAPIEDISESSTDKSKKTKASPSATKQVSAREDGIGGTFTVSATLDGK